MAKLLKKKILLGISGGIAAYKSAEITRLLTAENIDVRICMTQSATEFITPMTLQALSHNPVHTHLLDEQAEAAMGHIELARWADAILIAPATANVIAKLAHGFADDLLSTLCLATSSPIYLAPAMNQQMWLNQATQDNIATLKQRGIGIIGPGHGNQACGEVGPGRLEEPATIVNKLKESLPNIFSQRDLPEVPTTANPLATSSLLKNTNIMITAGPTREMIDPVRFITNKSSGKMGYSIASAAQKMGANVTLVSGPVSLPTPENVKRINVETANEMLDACENNGKNAHIFIATAAVADYAPKQVYDKKIKKTDDVDTLTLELTKNPDVLATISHNYPTLFTVGFAAETDNLHEYARKKLSRKNLNLIAANQVGDGKGFEVDENQLDLIWANGQTSLPLVDKAKLAELLMQHIANHYFEFKKGIKIA